MQVKLSFIFICLAIFYSSIAFSNEFDDEFGDDFSSEDINYETKETKKAPSNLQLYGAVKYTHSYNYAHKEPATKTENDFRGTSGMSLLADLNASYKINSNHKIKLTTYGLHDFVYSSYKNKYQKVPEGYENRLEVKEFFYQASFNSLDITLGRNIVVWGKADSIRITDAINPLNMTAPGMLDIKELRLGRAMAKADYFFNQQVSISPILLLETRYSLLPKYGSDFAPKAPSNAASMQITTTPNAIDEPNISVKNTGFALSLQGEFEGQDMSLYYLHDYVDNKNYKTNMYGFAYNLVAGSFLLKAEFASFDNYGDISVEAVNNKLLGLEYSAITDGSISIELAEKDQNKDPQYAVRFNQSYLNQTLKLNVIHYIALERNANNKFNKAGGYNRLWFDYSINDVFGASLGFIDYLEGVSPKFNNLKNNDRVFLSLQVNY